MAQSADGQVKFRGARVDRIGPLAHLVTLNADGSPQVSVIWAGLDGDELVSGHIDVSQLKMRNMSRDPRVALSFEAPGANAMGLREYLVVHGRVRLTEGGAAALLHRLAETYVGPALTFQPMPNPPPVSSHTCGSPRSPVPVVSERKA